MASVACNGSYTFQGHFKYLIICSWCLQQLQELETLRLGLRTWRSPRMKRTGREPRRREPEDLLERRENGKRHIANRRYTFDTCTLIETHDNNRQPTHAHQPFLFHTLINTQLMMFSFKEKSEHEHEEEEENQRPPSVPAPRNPPEALVRRLPEIPRDEPETEAQARPLLLYCCCLLLWKLVSANE